jgi:hypothetical protein
VLNSSMPRMPFEEILRRVEVATLREKNDNLHHRITREAGLAPRSPPPTEEPTRIGRITLKQPSRELDFEVTDDEIEPREPRIIPRRLNLTTASAIVVNWRSRGDHPAKKLSGSKVSPRHFQVFARFKADSPLYPDDKSKSTTLSQMKDSLSSGDCSEDLPA